MSKIGNQPITIDQAVTIQMEKDIVGIKGPLGELVVRIPAKISVAMNDGVLNVARSSEEKKVKALHGLIRSLIQNAVTGVTKPWEKRLQIVGTGYKVKMQGEDVVLEVGFSHTVPFKKPEGIKFAVEGNILIVSGIDKQYVGEIANKIKAIRKPDAYKGKGIRYEGQVIKLKPGKKAKTA